MEIDYTRYVLRRMRDGRDVGWWVDCDDCPVPVASANHALYDGLEIGGLLAIIRTHEMGAHGRTGAVPDARQPAPASIYLVARGDGDAVAAWTDRERAYEYAHNVQATVVELATKRDYRPASTSDD